MTPIRLDGKSLALKLEGELRERVGAMRARTAKVPALATILVGDDPASATYVKMKANACARVGMESIRVKLPPETTTQELVEEIEKLNTNPSVDGILLQHPVPPQIDERACFDSITVAKDVDGVTSLGFGRMVMKEPAFGSATATGIMRLLQEYALSAEGKHAVVVGRSPIIGRPLAMMLMNANATVTICHSKTERLPDFIGLADIVVGAVGKPEYIKGEWIRDGAIVIDAGYHPGGKGDIELAGIAARCLAYTPVPGGVGPMTIAMLIAHTAEAAERRSS